MSGAATREILARLREQNPQMSDASRSRLEDLESVLARFSEAAYGRDSAAAMAALDESLSTGERAVSALRREHSWLATQLRALRQRTGDSVKARGWARS